MTLVPTPKRLHPSASDGGQSRAPADEKTNTTTSIPAPAEPAAEHHLGAGGAVGSGNPLATPSRRRDRGGERQVDHPPEAGAAELPAEASRPSSDRLPRRDEPCAACEEGPLSPEDISKFEEDGFVMLKRAFDPKVAAACRESLWKRLKGEGIAREDPSTWVSKIGLAEIYGMSSSPKQRRGLPWKDALSPRLMSAVEQLLGPDAWEEFGCGWWVITFPGFAVPPWGAEGKWHCDGAHFRHYPHSREIGLLPIFLFSDVRSHGGGTAVIRGSHKTVAGLVWNKAGTTGLTGPELSRAACEAVLPAASEDVVETTGSGGDVLLTHPLLLHARSNNLAPVDESGVRFMCHPAVPLKRHLDLHAPPEAFSVVERIMWRACPSRRKNADGHAIPKPEECDHSPVELPPTNRRWKKKARSHGRGARIPATPQSQDPSEDADLTTNQAPKSLARPPPKGAETDRSKARGEQPQEGSDNPDVRGSRDDAAARSPAEEDPREAPHSGGTADGVDAEVMEAMGFGGFGGCRK
eukprot:g9192.t1